jgi:hypothetical protein
MFLASKYSKIPDLEESDGKSQPPNINQERNNQEATYYHVRTRHAIYSLVIAVALCAVSFFAGTQVGYNPSDRACWNKHAALSKLSLQPLEELEADNRGRSSSNQHRV